ncbi:hypothetical protein RA269_28580, partial [Pseudomonas syringae pv. tagetis]|uniref:hypothetical protein n=1 Tax=Pseudomonas syringae group genomosp. 7 TaxID=251699 RepID=UPI00377064E9
QLEFVEKYYPAALAGLPEDRSKFTLFTSYGHSADGEDESYVGALVAEQDEQGEEYSVERVLSGITPDDLLADTRLIGVTGAV